VIRQICVVIGFIDSALNVIVQQFKRDLLLMCGFHRGALYVVYIIVKTYLEIIYYICDMHLG
jgi:hypothetical protein